jgi:V/A-type H+-transporting ATPase subunit K
MFEFATAVTDFVVTFAQGTPTPTAGSGGPAIESFGAAAIAVGLAALGSGYAERGIGSAAVGALAEDSISLGNALLMTVLPETLVILALLVVFIA